MPLSSGMSIHDDTKHKGSAKRDAVSGVAGLDALAEIPLALLKTDEVNGIAGLSAGGDLLLPGSSIYAARDVADKIFGIERNSDETFVMFERIGVLDYIQSIRTVSGWSIVLHAGNVDAANGIAGLDANTLLGPARIPLLDSEYCNDFGYIDGNLSKTEVNTGSILGDAANSEINFTTPAVGDSGYLQLNNTITLDSSPLLLGFQLNSMNISAASDVAIIGLHDSIDDVFASNGVGWQIQEALFADSVYPFTVVGDSSTLGTRQAVSDGYFYIIATSTYVDFYRNGTFIERITTNIPTGPLHIRMSIGRDTNLTEIAIGKIIYKKS